MNTSSGSVETSAVSGELKRFITEKCTQVRAEIRAAEHPMSPESKSLFAAAEAGDWHGVFDALAAMHRGFREGESSGARSWAVPGPSVLSWREREVLRCLAHGENTKSIAVFLQMSLRSFVEEHDGRRVPVRNAELMSRMTQVLQGAAAPLGAALAPGQFPLEAVQRLRIEPTKARPLDPLLCDRHSL